MSRSLASYEAHELPYVIARRLKAKNVGLGKLAALDAPKAAGRSKAAPTPAVDEVADNG